MRALHIQLDRSKGPVYKQIASGLRELFQEGVLSRDSLIPSTRDLAEQFEVHRHTVTRALEELVAEGWVESEPGRGFRVVFSPEANVSVPSKLWSDFPQIHGLGPDGLEDYDFPSGKPDLRLFPEEFFRVLRSCLRDIPSPDLLGYSDPSGSSALRLQLREYLSRMRGVARGQVMVTHGSQEAIFLLGQLLARGKDKLIAVESLGYPPAWDALRLSGAELAGVPVDQEGLDVAALERLIQHKKPALLYLTPLHQYPTTVSLSLARRERLLELVCRHEIPVIEDDYDHEFHYYGRPTRPLAGEDKSGLVIYVSTFSKLVYPSARVGFCVVPDRLLEPLCRLKRATTRQNDLLIQETMASWMRQGGLDRHLRRMKKVYHHRLEVMSERLEKIGLSFHLPRGGMSLWVDLGERGADIWARCWERGLRLRPGSFYALDGGLDRNRFVRLGFAGTTPEEIQSGLNILEQAVRVG